MMDRWMNGRMGGERRMDGWKDGWMDDTLKLHDKRQSSNRAIKSMASRSCVESFNALQCNALQCNAL